jgi:thioester reductase-like protein
MNIPFINKPNTYWISSRVEACVKAKNEEEALKRFKQTIMFANRYLSKTEVIDIGGNSEPVIKSTKENTK